MTDFSRQCTLKQWTFWKGTELGRFRGFSRLPKFRGGYNSRNLTFSAWIKLLNSGSSEDSDDASIFSTDGSSTNHARLWYDINANGIGNRTYSFILGSTWHNPTVPAEPMGLVLPANGSSLSG